MASARPPPTDLGSRSNFALHLGDDLLTVWVHRRDLGLHGAQWEQRDQYEIPDGIELTGAGRLIKDGDDVWYLLDEFEDIHVHGDVQTNQASD